MFQEFMHMQLVVVSSSYLSDKVVEEEYFSSDELTYLSGNFKGNKLRDKLLGRIAVKHSVSENDFKKVIIQYNNFGKPVLDISSMFCSIAHSYGLGIAGAAFFKIGVDVELIRNHEESLLRSIASEEEISLFDEENPDTIVTKIWVMKEAVSKALGVGIAYPFTDMKIEKDKKDYSVIVECSKWFAKVFLREGYVIGYCYPYEEIQKRIVKITYLQ